METFHFLSKNNNDNALNRDKKKIVQCRKKIIAHFLKALGN